MFISIYYICNMNIKQDNELIQGSLDDSILMKKLFNLKKEIGSISKDSKNEYYKSKYFDINTLLSQLEPYLQKNTLLLLQPIKGNSVYSILRCVDSNKEVFSYLDLPNLNDPQKLGSCITYYRRYTLTSLLSLQAEDDDANLASNLQDKKWLNLNTKDYTMVVNALESKQCNMDYVKNKFLLSKKVETELNKFI